MFSLSQLVTRDSVLDRGSRISDSRYSAFYSRDSLTMSNQGENLSCYSFSLSSVLRSLDGLASKFAEGAFLFDHIQLKIFAIDSK